MRKIEWMAIVIFTWLAVEGFALVAFGSPIRWDKLPTIVATCLIAIFTFPASRGRT